MKPEKPNFHAHPGITGRWAVRATGATRARKVLRTKSQAWALARRLAAEHQVIAYLHDDAGMIKERCDCRSLKTTIRKVEIGMDAANPNNLRLKVNGSQWCKVYGFDAIQAGARARTIADALMAERNP